MNQVDREEEQLSEMFNSGEIDLNQYKEEMKELHREYHAQAQEAAEEAYERELSNW
jgi:hypothetical protein